MHGFPLKIVFLLVIALLPGCDPARLSSDRQAVPEDRAALRYLALGDSYTIGESVGEADRWPNQLARALVAEGLRFETVRIIARTGWTTGELLQALAEDEPQGEYDLVSLLIGVNNQYRGRDLEEFNVEFRSLLDAAVKYAGGDRDRVFVVSIPDWGVTPFAAGRDAGKIAREIDLFNAVSAEICADRGIVYIPVTDISREARNDPRLVAADGLHPSAEMYRRWVDERVRREAAEILR